MLRSPSEPSSASSLSLSLDMLRDGVLWRAPLLRLKEARGVLGAEEPSARPSSSRRPDALAAAMTSSSVACGLATFAFRCVKHDAPTTYPNVFRNCSIKDERLLRHVRGVRAQAHARQLRIWEAVKDDFALLRAIDAQDEFGERRLARRVHANHAVHLRAQLSSDATQ